MKGRSRRPGGWIVTALLAAASLAYVFFVFLPGQLAIADLRRDLREKQLFIVQADRLTNAIIQTKGRLDAADKQAAKWRQAAPSEHELSGVFQHIAGLAQEVGVVVLRFDPQTPVELATVAEVNVSLTCQGTFRQLLGLLERLERQSATIWVRQLQMRPTSEASEILHCELDLTIFVDNHDNSD